MRSMRRKRALVVSTATILLCLSIVAGATWALFTDTQVVKNHLVAGDLTISLTRTELTKTYLNDDGFLVTKQVQKPTDSEVGFTNPTGENVFGKTMPIMEIVIIVALGVLAGYAVYLIVRAVKSRKKGGEQDGNGGNDGKGGNGGWGNDRRNDRQGGAGWNGNPRY